MRVHDLAFLQLGTISSLSGTLWQVKVLCYLNKFPFYECVFHVPRLHAFPGVSYIFQVQSLETFNNGLLLYLPGKVSR